jgi:hypothetical protein
VVFPVPERSRQIVVHGRVPAIASASSCSSRPLCSTDDVGLFGLAVRLGPVRLGCPA